jgi:hypothetical protein
MTQVPVRRRQRRFRLPVMQDVLALAKVASRLWRNPLQFNVLRVACGLQPSSNVTCVAAAAAIVYYVIGFQVLHSPTPRRVPSMRSQPYVKRNSPAASLK